MPVCLRCVLVRCGGVQYTDDGSEHRQGVGAKVDGEEVLRRGESSGVRLEVVHARGHLDEGVDRIACFRRDR